MEDDELIDIDTALRDDPFADDADFISGEENMDFEGEDDAMVEGDDDDVFFGPVSIVEVALQRINGVIKSHAPGMCGRIRFDRIDAISVSGESRGRA